MSKMHHSAHMTVCIILLGAVFCEFFVVQQTSDLEIARFRRFNLYYEGQDVKPYLNSVSETNKVSMA